MQPQDLRPAGPPSWELAGAVLPRQPAHGGLPYHEALAAWGHPDLMAKLAATRRAHVDAKEAEKIAAAELQAWRDSRRTVYGSQVAVYPTGRPPEPIARHEAARAAAVAAGKAEMEALRAAEADFKERWYSGELIAFGIRENEPVLMRSARRHELRFSGTRAEVIVPLGRSRTEPDFHEVLFYRSADHSHLRALADDVLTTAGPSSPSARSGQSQSAKARLRADLKGFLEREAKAEMPRAASKSGWISLARVEFGLGEVTDNLFEQVWAEADLPSAWREPGRRS